MTTKCLWYDMIMIRLVNDRDIYGMICIWWKLLCPEAWNVIIWYIYIVWMIWYDWHVKRWTSMKYNLGVCMKDMINDIWNDKKNDMICMEH